MTVVIDSFVLTIAAGVVGLLVLGFALRLLGSFVSAALSAVTSAAMLAVLVVGGVWALRIVGVDLVDVELDAYRTVVRGLLEAI